MANIPYVYGEAGDTLSSSGTFVDGLTILGTALTANTKYLLIARAFFGMASASVNGEIRVTTADDSNIATKSLCSYEFEQTANNRLKSWFFAHSFTTDGTPADVIMQARATTGGNAWRFQQKSMLLIDLDDIGTEGTDYYEDINAATGTEISTSVFGTTLATLSGSDLGSTEEWMIFGSNKIGIGSGGRFYSTSLEAAQDTSFPLSRMTIREEGEATDEFRMAGWFLRHKASSGTPDVILKTYEEAANGNMTDEGSYLIALPISYFVDFAWTGAAGQDNLVIGEETVETLAHTPDTDGNYLVLGRGRSDIGVGDSDLFQLWMETGTTEIRTGDSLPTHNQLWDTTKDEEAGYTMQVLDVTGATTFNLQADAPDNGVRISDTYIFLIALDDGVSGTSYTRTATDPVGVTDDVLSDLVPPVGPQLTALTFGSSVSDATSVATASISPTGDNLILAAVNSTFTTTTPVEPTATGNGLTWVVVRTFGWDDAGTTRRLTLFRAMGSSPTTGAITFDFGSESQTEFLWSIVEYADVLTTGSNGADAVVQHSQNPSTPGGGSTISIGMATFDDADNATYGVGVKEVGADDDLTGDSNMIEVHRFTDANNDSRMLVQKRDGFEAVVNWTHTSRRRGGFALEIAKASGDVSVTVTDPVGVTDDTTGDELSLPFTDDFTGTDTDPPDSAKWTVDVDTGCSAEILSNEARLLTSGAANDWASIEATSVTDIQDATLLVKIDPTSGNNGTQYQNVWLRAFGGLTAGDPDSGVLLQVRTDDDSSVTQMWTRKSGTYDPKGSGSNSRTGTGVPIWVRMEVEDVGSDTVIRHKTWDDGDPEPGQWDIEFTDTSPGVLFGATGTLVLTTIAGVAEVANNRIDNVRFNTLLTLPFTDDYTGTNGDEWDWQKWATSEVGSVSADTDIQSNTGRMHAEDSADDFSSATSAHVTDIQDSQIELTVEPISPSALSQWLYVMLRSTGEQQTSGDRAGRPVTAYYWRFNVASDEVGNNDFLYRRIANSESSSLVSDSGSPRNAGEKFKVKMEIEDVGSDVVIRMKSWDFDASEPGSWNVTHTDTSPGALHGATGVLQLVTRATSNSTPTVHIDDITYDALATGITRTVTDPVGVTDDTTFYVPPITIVGTPQTNSAIDGADVTLTFDGTPAEFDVVVLFGGTGDDDGAGDIGPSTAGYTQQALHHDSDHLSAQGVWTKVLGSSPDATVVCQGSGDTLEGTAYVSIVLRGVNNSTPMDAAIVELDAGGGTNGNPPAITTVTDGAWVIAAMGSNGDIAPTVYPSGYINTAGDGASDSLDTMAAFATKEIVTAGSEDPGTFTAQDRDNYMMTIAIRPASDGPKLTALTSGSSVTGATSVSTASISPTGDNLILAAIDSTFSSTTPVEPTASGNGLTWVVVRTFGWDDATTTRRLTLFRAMGSSPSAGAITFDFGAETQDEFRWTVVEYADVLTTGSNGADAVVQDVQDPSSPGGGTTIQIALAAFADVDNATYAVASKEQPNDADMVGDGSMSTVYDFKDANNDSRMFVQEAAGRIPVVDWSWTTTRRRGGIALEIAKDSGVTNFTETVTDAVGVTDDTLKAQTIVITDPVGVTDDTIRLAPAVRTATDPAGVTDDTIRVVIAVRTTTDPAGVTDLTTTVRTVEIIETVGVTDLAIDDLVVPVVETEIRPVSDISGGWDTAPTGSQPLWQQVDEETPSDTDYIFTVTP